MFWLIAFVKTFSHWQNSPPFWAPFNLLAAEVLVRAQISARQTGEPIYKFFAIFLTL